MFEVSQQDLSPRSAILIRHYTDVDTGNEFLVVAWDGLDSSYLQEYKQFLSTYTWGTNFDDDTESRVIDNPVVGTEETLVSGAWMQVSIEEADGGSTQLSLTLLRVYSAVKENGVYPRAVLLNKDQYRSTEANLVLQFKNLDPRNLDALAKSEFTADDYTAIQTGNDTYSGTWANVAAPSGTDENGAGVITWYLTRHNNDDAVYRFSTAPDLVETHFFKYRMLDSGKTDFEEHYYFDQNGLYYSTDGATYSKLDGVDVDIPYPDLPDSAKRLNQPCAGRLIYPQENRREDRTTDLFVRIVFVLGESNTGTGGSPIVSYGEPEEVVRFLGEYKGVSLPDNLDLVGRYVDIPAEDGTEEDNKFGEHGELTGRRITAVRVGNPRIENGLFYYDVMEVETTAPIQTNDGWFLIAAIQDVERESRSLYSAVCDKFGNAGWEPYDQIYADLEGPRLWTVENRWWRPKTIVVERKFFIRQPTDDDLSAAGIDLSIETGIKKPAEGVLILTRHEVGGSGRNCFIERTAVTLGAKARDDDSAIDHTFSDRIDSGNID